MKITSFYFFTPLLLALFYFPFTISKQSPEVKEELSSRHQTYRLQKNTLLALDPIDLLCWWRFDIVAKYIYAKHRKMNIKSDWAERLYAEHLRVWGNFHEWDGSKNSFSDYLHTFHQTLDSVEQRGFDPTIATIQIDKHKYPCDGSHRIAACLLYNKKVVCKYDPRAKRATYSSALYFKTYDKHVKHGLEEKYLDAMALEYAKLKNKTHIVVTSPKTKTNPQAVRKLLRSYGNIVYEKKITFTPNGLINLSKYLQEITPNKQRLFSSTPKTNSIVYVYLFEHSPAKKYQNLKKQINKGKSHINFITNSHQKAVELARMFFISNSIDLLNHRKPTQCPQFTSLFKKFCTWITQNNLNDQIFCLDTDATLAAYGIKDCTQLYLYCHNKHTLLAPYQFNKSISSGDLNDILFNPERYLYYKNIKFIALPQALRY